MAQVLGFLPPTWEAWIEFFNPGYSYSLKSKPVMEVLFFPVLKVFEEYIQYN